MKTYIISLIGAFAFSVAVDGNFAARGQLGQQTVSQALLHETEKTVATPLLNPNRKP